MYHNILVSITKWGRWTAFFKRVTWKASALTMLISLLAFTVVLAASGGLDKTFSGDGLVTSFAVPSDPNRWDIGYDIAIQPNGKIVAAGWNLVPFSNNQAFALIRYNKNGSLDTTFSGDGRLLTNLGGVDYAYDVAVQPDGKIIAVGLKCNLPTSNPSAICDVALARYKTNGALDKTFSGDGKVLTDFGGGDNGSTGGLVIQPDGKIVVAGYMWNGADYDFAVYRYKANGSPDNTFGTNGKVRIPFGTGRKDIANALALQSNDGKIVVSGYTGNASDTNRDFAMVRLNPNGTRDTSFSGDGRVTTNFGGDEIGIGLDGHQDGRIVLVGQKIDAGGIHFIAIARYKSNGKPDTTFNGTGKKVFRVGPTPGTWHSWAADVIVQPNNQIVVLGNTSDFISINDIAIIRLNNNGGFDNNFGTQGKMFIDFGGDDYGYDLARQSDSKYVLVGNTNATGGQDFALARVLP
jgi:uncharacterized delta-60 repeat protein